MAEVGYTGNRAIYEQIATSYNLASGNSTFQVNDNISTFTHISIQYVWASVTGTVDGTLEMQSSNDGTNWDTELTHTMSGANASTMHLHAEWGSRYVRAKLTVNNITGGTLNVHFAGKD